MKKRIGMLFLMLAAGTVVLGGCAGRDADQEKPEIRIGMMASSDAVPYVMIDEKDLDDKYGFDLDLETFTSAKDRDAAFQAGELDGVLTDYIGVCMYQNAGFDVKITGITDGDYILVAGKNSGIAGMEDIKGKSVAISENTLIEYTLENILSDKGMKPEDVKKEVVPRIPDRLELLRNGKIDISLLPEPFATLAIQDGAVSLLSANEIGLYPALSAFSQESIDKKSDTIKKLYQAYNESVDYINKSNIGDYEDIVIEAVGYPAELKGKIELPKYRKSELPPKEDLDAAVLWAGNKQLCKKDLTYEALTYSPYE